jgi:hypothetical protein
MTGPTGAKGSAWSVVFGSRLSGMGIVVTPGLNFVPIESSVSRGACTVWMMVMGSFAELAFEF